MNTPSLIDKALLLKRTPFFRSLDLDLLLPISDKMQAMWFQPREVVFGVHQPAKAMYLVLSGSIAIFDAQGTFVRELSEGEFFGDESIFNGRPREYTATASQTSQLLSLSRTNLVTVLMECPTVALSLLEAYAAPFTFRER